jgi:hypothetical protein
MRSQFLCAALALGAISTVSMAKNELGQLIDAATGQKSQGSTQEPAAVRQAVEKAYPGSQSQVQDKRTENGIQIYDVRITPKSGPATFATLTGSGEFLSSGNDLGANPQNLPADVKEFAEGIWKNPPTDVRAMQSTYYYVNVGAGGAGNTAGAADRNSHTYELRFDPAGRLIDIKSPNQIRHADWQTLANAPADVTSQLEQFVRQRYAGSQPVAVKMIPKAPGFYQVRFTLNGGDGWMITDANHNISDEATTLPIGQLPPAINATLTNTFNGDHVIWAARDEVRYYQLRETIGNQLLTMRVQPDGNVLSVHNGERAGQAIPAAAHQNGR